MLERVDVSRETSDAFDRYLTLLREENEHQNLVSRSSLENAWSRHILDSIQLTGLAPLDADWLDIGSGAGLPGLILGILGVRSIVLVEPRRLRTDFLSRCKDELGLRNITVVTAKAEQLDDKFDVITARAVASLTRLFEIGEPLLAPRGQWVLPKGRSAAMELAEAESTWHGRFRLEPSQTDPEARILVAHDVRRKRKAGRG